MTDEEHAELSARAAAAGVSLPRFLIESATAGEGRTAPERRAVYATLLAARRTLAGAANNLNQLARWSNIEGREHPDTEGVIGAVEAAAARFGDAVQALVDEAGAEGQEPG